MTFVMRKSKKMEPKEYLSRLPEFTLTMQNAEAAIAQSV
jgi:hypothetical protein